MKAFARTSLQRKVMLVVMATTCVALLLSSAALLIYELRTHKRSWADDLKSQANIIAYSSAPALLFNDPSSASKSLALLRLRPQINAAAVYRVDKSLFAYYANPDAHDTALPPQASEPREVMTRDRLELYLPIVENGEALGTVFVRADYDITPRLLDYLLILIGVMSASVAVAGLVMARLQRTITAPILDVARVAREVMQRRDFSLRAPKTSDDEVGTLVDAFNDMLSEVGQRTAALEQSNRSLSIEMGERHKAEEALTLAARTKDEFLATLAHELRNPLAPISNAVEILRRGKGRDPAVADRALEIMVRQLRQMVRLIDDLLDVSRITTGKLLLRRDRVDLMNVLNGAIEIASPVIEARGHRLSLELPDQPVMLEGDATRLGQVFANLLNNAAKYTDVGGRIWLKLERVAGGASVSVTDSGVGIAPEMQETIFDMFVQLDTSLERGKAGLGVGLTLARQLIHLHGGRIVVHSAGVGQGSSFTVWLPLQEAPVGVPSPISVSARPTSAPALARRVLIADDNVDFASSLRSLLESLGHEVGTAHDGTQALALAVKHRPEVILLDIGMPGLNGYELARRLRAAPETAGSVLVAITGWGQDKDRERARAAGFQHHLVKPLEIDDLLPLLAPGTADAAAP